MGSSSSGKKRKGQRKKEEEEEDINVNAVPEDSREIVQAMKEIVNCSEQEIYPMLGFISFEVVSLKVRRRNEDERKQSKACFFFPLIDSFQEVKSKRNKKKEAKEKSRMGERDKGSNVNADSVPVDFKEVVQNVQEIVKCSEEETKKMLVECNMDADKAINCLLSQEQGLFLFPLIDSVQQVKSNQDEKKESLDTSDSQRVDSSNQNRELRNGSDNYVGQGGGNKFDSDETSNVQGIRNQLTSSSTTAGILGPGPPLNRNVLNVETKRMPTSSGEAVPSLSVPSSRLIPAWGCGTSGQKTMADVLKMGLASSNESVTKAPVKDDCPLPERPNESAARRDQLRESASVSNQNLCDDDFACPLSNSVIESAAGEDQLGESTSVSNQNFRDDDYGGSQLLCDNHSNKNDVTEFEHNQNKDPPVSVVTSLLQLPTENDEPEAPVKELQHLRFDNYGSGMNGSVVLKMGIASLKESVTKGPLKDDCHLPERPDESAARRDESALVSNQNLHDNFSYFSNSIFEFDARRNQLRESASVSKQNLRDDGVTYPLSTSYDAKTEQFRKSTAEFIHNLRIDDVACPLSNSFVESAARGDQFGESTSSIFNQRFRDDDFGGSQLLCDNYNNKNDETYLVQRRSFKESASLFKQNLRDDSVTYPLSTSYDAEREQFLKFTPEIIQNLRVDDLASQLSTSFIESAAISAKDPPASVVTSLQQLSTENDEPEAYVKELKHWRFCSFGSGMNGSCQPSGLPSRFFDDDDSEDISDFADDLSLSYLTTRDGEFHEDEEQRLWINAANGQTEPTQENQYESSSARDFVFDNRQLLNPVVAPLSLQMQNINTFPAMRQQAYTREPDPQYSASPHNQSMPTISSLCPRQSGSVTEALQIASISEPQMNQQAMNHHYSQPMVPSGNNGNMMNYPYSQTTQNDTYNMSPSAFQKHGGRNNSSYHLRSLTAPLPHYRNNVLSPSAVPFVPSTHSSAYGSTNGSTHGFGMLSDNVPNLKFEYEDDFHTQFSNHLATLQHQNGTSSMWTPQRLNDSVSTYYRLYSGPQNQQSQSLRHSQQQQQKEPEQTYRRIG
ncbi:UBA-like superfamily [Arabidopsis suecica]|uniref:UBA-like superfamily n=1 Tax=Arabidopsis suecica TaxID=45249 RepID=A0A8T1XTZ0_ARASU|nr:UBA-like superfamily [Arabidopsis suecica]